MMLLILTLVDVHTLFVLIFHNHLSPLYVFSGSSFAILKGLIFYVPYRDKFSFADIVVGVFMLFLLITELPSFLWWIISLFLIYKIVAGFAGIK